MVSITDWFLIIARRFSKFSGRGARRSQNAKEFVVLGALISGDDPVVIIYPVALVAASANPDAEFFLAYLTSQAATKIFLEQGFEILSK